MSWRRLFNLGVTYKAPRIRGEPTIVSSAPQGEQGVFITPQSLVTFPVATFVIGLVWKVFEALVPRVHGSLWVPAATAFVIGAFICVVGITDPKASRTTRDIAIAIGVGIVNIFYLFASSAGIVTAISRT